MARVSMLDDIVTISLTRREKLLGLLRDLQIPLTSVTSAEVVADGLAATHGLRAPGLHVPGRRAVGTWRGRGRVLVSVHAGRPALRLRLAGERWDSVLVTVDDPDGAARRICAELERVAIDRPERPGGACSSTIDSERP